MNFHAFLFTYIRLYKKFAYLFLTDLQEILYIYKYVMNMFKYICTV